MTTYSSGQGPVFLLGTASAPATANTPAVYTTLPGNTTYRNICVEGTPAGASVTVTAVNSLRPSNVMAVTAPDGSPLVFTVAEIVAMVGFSQGTLQIGAALSGAGVGTSLRCYVC